MGNFVEMCNRRGQVQIQIHFSNSRLRYPYLQKYLIFTKIYDIIII